MASNIALTNNEKLVDCLSLKTDAKNIEYRDNLRIKSPSTMIADDLIRPVMVNCTGIKCLMANCFDRQQHHPLLRRPNAANRAVAIVACHLRRIMTMTAWSAPDQCQSGNPPLDVTSQEISMANIRSVNRRHKRALAARHARLKLATPAPIEKRKPVKVPG